jgi:hypothetical protein
MCSSKPICAVLKSQMCSHQINKNITSKQCSHVLVFIVDAPDARNAVIEHQKSKRFLGEDIRAGVMEQEVKLGRAKPSKRD